MKILLLFQIATDIMGFLNPILVIVAPFITQFIKNQLKLAGNGAVILTVVLSVLIAVLGAWATGMLVVGTSTATLAMTVFTASTLIYKFIISNDTVQANLPTALQNKPTSTV